MRSISTRILTALLALLFITVGAITAFAFLCTALYAFIAGMMSPPLAALASGGIVLVTAVFLAMLVLAIGWKGARRGKADNMYVAGRAIGAFFAREVQEFAETNPRASLFISLLAGFIAGSRR
jgi:hypothetical protein